MTQTNKDEEQKPSSNSTFKKWFYTTALGCSTALAFSPSPVQGTESIGTLLFSEGSLVAVEHTKLPLERYTPFWDTQQYHPLDLWKLNTQVNFLDPEGFIQLSAQQDEVWVYLQYFTDLNGDDVYEWEIDENYTPVWDSFTENGELVSTSLYPNEIVPISQCTLSMKNLFYGSIAKEQQRTTWGSGFFNGISYTNSGSSMYCFTFSPVPLHLGETSELTQSYYIGLDYQGFKNPKVLGAYTYKDVDFRESYFEGVDYCIKAGLMYGTDLFSFYPQETTSRAMAIQALYNMVGNPEVEATFLEDVSATDWYATPFYWAVQENILSNPLCRPSEPITQVELLEYLYHLQALPELSPDFTHSEEFTYHFESHFTPEEVNILSWGLSHGLIHPNDEGHFFPDHQLRRGETATLLANFATLCETNQNNAQEDT